MDLSLDESVVGFVENVSLREEGVDLSKNPAMPSVSVTVSLREEGVDLSMADAGSLPPRGGSGFKPQQETVREVPRCLPPRGGSGFKLSDRSVPAGR